jgi:hypothetical protein
VGIIAVFAVGAWLVWARKWFVGPVREIEAERRGVDISEPGALERAEAEGKLNMEDSPRETTVVGEKM